MLTQDQIKANINAMEQQGASQSEIQQYLDSLKGSTTNTPQPSTPESGFLKNVLQSLVHVPATLVSTLASLGADVKSFAGAAGSGFKTMDFSEGDKIRQQGLDLGIFGNVKPVGGDINNQTFGGLAGNVAGLAGNAALDVATLGSDSLAKAVGESTLKQVGNIAAKNAGIGAGYSLASSVENGDNWLDTLLHTVEGAAVGGIAGPALHYAIPAVAKTVGGVASDVIDKGVLGGLESTANKIGNKIDTITSKIFGNVPEGEVGKITIPKNVEKGIDAGGEVLAELESMKGVNIPHDDTELRNAILETVKDGKFEYVEIPYGGDKKISFTPTIKNLTEDTKKLANDQEKLITEKYNRSYSKKELDTVINAERQNGIKNYAVEDTDKYDKALAAEIKNQKFKKLTSAKDILSKIRSIKFDPTADSATQQARNDVKMALTNLLKKDFPGFAEMNNKIHKNFLVIDAFGNGLAKPGASIFEKLAGISGALAAAPQGIVASFATRNFASKLANHIFGGRYSLDKATKNFINESQPIIEKWISQGVSPKNIFSLIQEKYAYGKPSPETVLKIITELQGKADELSRQTTEVAAQKLAEQKSLIRIIKGMGNDANAIKEELVSQGINITDADAKTFAALNKNSGKSITPYIEKLARIGTIKQSTDQSQ